MVVKAVGKFIQILSSQGSNLIEVGVGLNLFSLILKIKGLQPVVM